MVSLKTRRIIMFNRTWWVLALCVAAMLAACVRGETPSETPSPQRGMEPLLGVIPNDTPPRTIPSALLGAGSSEALLLPSSGLESMEEKILESDVVARVDYLSSRTFLERVPDPEYAWAVLLEFRFRVHEYLKGSGPNEIGGIVYLLFDTEQEARDGRAAIADAHDSRWDDREAIILLAEADEDGILYDRPLADTSDRYWFGAMVIGSSTWGIADAYTVASKYRKLWLPAADETSGARRARSSSEKRYLLDEPVSSSPVSGASARGASSSTVPSTSTAPTISLSDLKARIAALEAEADAGGTPEYRTCVTKAYQDERWVRYTLATLGVQREDFSVASGLPAGTIAGEYDDAWARDRNTFSRLWFEGPNKDLLRSEQLSDFRRWISGHGVKHSVRLLTTRPLPEGVFELPANGQSPVFWPCNRVTDPVFVYYLTVTAPESSLHEAFFDPVDIGTAVGADSSNGVLKPNAFSLDGATTTISSLKWEDGAVSMTLNPTASLANYAIDFIDVTGTTTLSLSSDNASTTPLTWTVPDKPWNAGDLLMLRIHKPVSNDATLSALALSGVDLAFSPATTTYTASVPATTTQTTVTPTLNHDAATYVVKLGGVVDDDGTIPLAAGANVITIDVTAEDAVTTQTYSVTITRATPSEPITVTLIPRVDGLTFFDIDIQWNYSGSCENYFVAITTDADYQISSLGFHPPETSSHYVEGGWLYNNVPDFWVVVECRASGDSQEVGRASLRAAHPDNN